MDILETLWVVAIWAALVALVMNLCGGPTWVGASIFLITWALKQD
jgi:hypothetical protein